MKRKILVTYFILLYLLLILAQTSLAHTGGHHHENFKTWNNISDNTQIKASFLNFDGKNVFLENNKNNIIKIPLENLSKSDQSFVIGKFDFLKNINKSIDVQETPSLKITINTLIILLFITGLLFLSLKLKKSKLSKIVLTTSIFSISYVACTATDLINKVSKTDISFLEESFGMFKDTVKTRSDDKYFYVESNGIPKHNMMVGIKSWQQQVPLDHPYTGENAWSIPLQPVLSEEPLSTKNNFFKGGIAIAVNGIPIFNALNNRGDDALISGELDQWGGHCGRADDYHYHTAPLHLEEELDSSNPIAFALDGFAVYGSKEPDGSDMDPLDENNGHFDSNNLYHYHGVKDYPYMIGKMRGNVEKSNSDEIIPQPKTNGVREFLQPLQGAEITDFKSIGENSYSLEYTVENKKSYVNYNWDDSGNYTFDFVSSDGTTKTETYQRK